MRQVVWTPAAETDLDDILFYISFVDRNPVTGERIFHQIRDAVSKRAKSDTPGQRHPESPNEWLYFKFKRWLIFYHLLPEGNKLEVVRVVDAQRDLPRQFRDSF